MRSLDGGGWQGGQLSPGEWRGVVREVAEANRLARLERDGAGFVRRTFRKKTLPPIAPHDWLAMAAPLVEVVADDARPDAPMTVSIDVRGTQSPDKVVWKGALAEPLPPRVRTIDETRYSDPILDLHARLVDGTRCHLSVVRRVRARRIVKRSASNKIKVKHKEKTKTVISAKLVVDGARPVHDPPAGVPVTVDRSGVQARISSRATLTDARPEQVVEVALGLLVGVHGLIDAGTTTR